LVVACVSLRTVSSNWGEMETVVVIEKRHFVLNFG